MRTRISAVGTLVVAVVAVVSPTDTLAAGASQTESLERLNDARAAVIEQSSIVYERLREAALSYPSVQEKLEPASHVADAVLAYHHASQSPPRTSAGFITVQFGRYALATLVESQAHVIAWASMTYVVEKFEETGEMDPVALRWAVDTVAAAEVLRQAMQAELDARRQRQERSQR